MSESLFSLLVLPLLIFLSRVVDVSIGTMRVIFVSRGYKKFAVFCGFFEVMIWLIAITQIMNNLTSPLYYIAYAGGFAAGNFVGMMIEERIALGNVLLSVVTLKEPTELRTFLKEEDYGVTIIPAHGMYGPVKVLLSVIPRSELGDVVKFIKKVNPNAFYTIEDVRFVNQQSPAFGHVLKRHKRKNVLHTVFRKGK